MIKFYQLSKRAQCQKKKKTGDPFTKKKGPLSLYLCRKLPQEVRLLITYCTLMFFLFSVSVRECLKYCRPLFAAATGRCKANRGSDSCHTLVKLRSDVFVLVDLYVCFSGECSTLSWSRHWKCVWVMRSSECRLLLRCEWWNLWLW